MPAFLTMQASLLIQDIPCGTASDFFNFYPVY